MSFANYDLEAQRPLNKNGNVQAGPGQSKEQNELDSIIQKTSLQLQSFGNLISQFDSQRRLIGSRRDNSHLRGNIDELTKKISDLGRAIQALIQNVSQLINTKSTKKYNNSNDIDDNEDDSNSNNLEITNRQIVIKERLVSEFNDLHKSYQNSTRQYNEKKNAYPLKQQQLPNADETTPLIKDDVNGTQQQQLQVQEQVQEQDQINETELQYHLLLTEERNREIQQVSRGIVEVNSIFKDLGELVHQQGEQLDTVEDNIFHMHGNVKQADSELRKADNYQRSKGKWSCIILIALCIFVLVVVLAVIS